MPKDKPIKNTIHAKDTEIAVFSAVNKEDYISLTDIARYKNPEEPKMVVANWLRNHSTIEFLGVWEEINNPEFNRIEFEAFKNESGANAFTLSPQKWILSTNAIGLVSKAGRYGGGTFAHKDIAFEFASWISPEFKLYIIKDYQRLKEDEQYRLSLDWSLNRTLSKINYRIHTDAIKEHLIPPGVSSKHQGITYANEADVLNVALFGKTAKEWRDENPDTKGNIRDTATLEQLIVLANMESFNAELIRRAIPQRQRLLALNQMAVVQLRSLLRNSSVKRLKGEEKNKLPERKE